MKLKLLLKLLKLKRLSQENRAEVLNVLLESVQALPVREIVSYALDGTVMINGRKLTPEEAISLRQGANTLQNNHFYRLLKEQIAWEAIKMGVHQSQTLDAVLMSKAALWLQQQEMRLITEIAGEPIEERLDDIA